MNAQAIQRVSEAAIRARESGDGPVQPTKVILMSTVGVSNPSSEADRAVRDTCGQKCAFACLRCCLPPHADNEQAAVALRRVAAASGGALEWCVVRPDGLLSGAVSEYALHQHLTTSLFDAGTTTRENVAHFICELVEKGACWEAWKGQMPVILNENKKTTGTEMRGDRVAPQSQSMAR